MFQIPDLEKFRLSKVFGVILCVFVISAVLWIYVGPTMFSMYFCFMLQSEYNTVVKFIPTEPDDCEEVEAVPVGWLSPRKTRCYWPL